MKFIVTESQIKKFNKENLNKGKFGDAIEQVILMYLEPYSICDVAVFQSEHDKNFYIGLIMFKGSSHYNLGGKIERFVKQFLPVNIMIMVTDIIDDPNCVPI